MREPPFAERKRKDEEAAFIDKADSTIVQSTGQNPALDNQ